MYSRITNYRKTDGVVGAHQKIDRAARRVLAEIAPDGIDFPAITEILYFEGSRGPDGLNSKSPGIDEPTHILMPDNDDGELAGHIKDHIYNLGVALKKSDRIRASFEAAWLAHMITDGLTPAHHYPLKKEIKMLDSREAEEIDRVYKKWVLPGSNPASFVRNNWRYIGPKGVMISHLLYELGVATMISPIAPKQLMLLPTDEEIEAVKQGRYIGVFYQGINNINDLKMYESYMKKGWTQSLATQTRQILVPEIVKQVALGWLAATYEVEK